MTPDSQTQIPLDELNQLIADQRGCTIEELAVSDGSQEPAKKTTAKVEVPVESAKTSSQETVTFELTPAEMRSRADALFKEAQRLRREADQLDPVPALIKSEAQNFPIPVLRTACERPRIPGLLENLVAMIKRNIS